MSECVLYFDGLCDPNPGLGCWAFVLNIGENKYSGSGVMRDVNTSNSAEYMGLIQGLRAFFGIYGTDPEVRFIYDLRLTHLKICGDSKLVINQLQGYWEVHSDWLRPLYEEAKLLTDRIKRVEFMWLPREQNKETDKLTREAYKRHTGEEPKELWRYWKKSSTRRYV